MRGRTVKPLFCILLALFVAPSKQISNPDDPHYWAGVVEFSSDRLSGEPEERSSAFRLTEYLRIINSAEADPTDVIVFPESTLNDHATASFVPDPNDRIAPCNNLQYEPVVRDISCAARNRKKYILINLTEKAHCPMQYDTRPCSSDGLYHFNTNVAFDREGVVVSRYRKFNLFGEKGTNTTVYPESVSFETDFGVRFGHFICFDMMFNVPALDLVELGITDFIFPTMWFSELPFLTAVQIQQGWAYSNNVNLLAAGASFPGVGSTGTGIYAGRRGAITSVMTYNPETKLYVAQVPKVQFPNAAITKIPQAKGTPSQMAKLLLKRDQIDQYATKDLPMVSNNQLEERVCYGSHCCNFTLNYTVKTIVQNTNYYRYKLAAYDSNRTFDGFADGLITTCAIFACSSPDYSDCSRRFGETETYDEAVTFNSIKIVAKFADNRDTFVVPNNVDTSIIPFDVTETEYSVVPSVGDAKPHNIITYQLTNPHSDLFTFAIWARKFDSYPISGANRLGSGFADSVHKLEL
ncbi:vanin-like protein 1 isoform X2 [Anopheles ziemanni]|uniref:vanin-like protein 1 isoform X2 n=1 Tax=Anopheles coustani TaxID=139045 RepID=UPI0026592799|nr:vanin-like protein 1 isoform X2 [Anopheles coustani]XP_058171410.1 vanin-like protein 1 isoform X2 [Anopheles ziemanni]